MRIPALPGLRSATIEPPCGVLEEDDVFESSTLCLDMINKYETLQVDSCKQSVDSGHSRAPQVWPRLYGVRPSQMTARKTIASTRPEHRARPSLEADTGSVLCLGKS